MGIQDPIVRVYCDTDDCGEEEEFEMTPLAQNSFDNRNLDKKMERSGWTTEGCCAYCPTCSEDRKEEDAP